MPDYQTFLEDRKVVVAEVRAALADADWKLAVLLLHALYLHYGSSSRKARRAALREAKVHVMMVDMRLRTAELMLRTEVAVEEGETDA